MHSWQSDESALLAAFEQEHELLGATGEQLRQALGSMEELLGLVHRNQAMMGIIAQGHEIGQVGQAAGGV